jgi:hypothetical protein
MILTPGSSGVGYSADPLPSQKHGGKAPNDAMPLEKNAGLIMAVRTTPNAS